MTDNWVFFGGGGGSYSEVVSQEFEVSSIKKDFRRLYQTKMCKWLDLCLDR